MAIDPKLYEKYSGRSGDPYKRLGEALSQGAARKQQLGTAKASSFSDRYVIGGLKAHWWLSIIGSIAVFIIVLIMMI